MSAAVANSSAPAAAAGAAAAAAAPQAAQAGAPVVAYASSSLYVGDLNTDVTEGMLFEMFNLIGPVASIRVCRDGVTRRSLGYAYVNFHAAADAERALDTLNNQLIKNRPCRIMWSQRDPSVRKSGAGNIFIKNLHKSIDLKALQDTFCVFGPILSCKVVTDETGESMGYGFVHFNLEESAKKAVDSVNGMELAGQTVFVAKFVPKKERIQQQGDPLSKVTNVYCKNLPDPIQTDKDLEDYFKEFGPITSVFLAIDAETKKSKGFGFVNFATPAGAKKAMDAKNGFMHGEPPKELYVGRAQKKSEREADLRQKMEQIKQERMTKYQGVNLYVKNLEDTVNDDKLREEFAQFGTVSSAKVMVDEKGNSKGFGFVCFTTPEEATRAVTEMNGRMIGQKPIYVALAQRKDIRRVHLEQQYARKNKAPVMASGMGVPGYPGSQAGFFYAPQGQMQAQGFVYPQQMMPRARGAAWGGQPQTGSFGGGVPGQQGGFIMPVNQRGGQQGANANRRQGGQGPRRGQNIQGGRGGHQQGGRQMMMENMAPVAGGVPYGYPTVQQIAAGPLDAKTIALLPLEQQKLVVGEKLYPLIAAVRPELAGKITGMLLDSYFTEEIIHLIESPESLSAKIQEAMQVLEAHAAAQASATGNA